MSPLAGVSSGDPSPARAGAAPRRLGRYELVAKIAEGGMATVFVARVARGVEPSEDRSDAVAIKMIRDEFARNDDFLTMFEDEARIVSRLCHPNIVRTREFGSEGGRVFIAMDLLLGQSLWNVWEACRARRRRLRYDVIAWIGARVADGLHHAHEMVDEDGGRLDIVHRDVNATNVFVTYDGDVKVIDFGLAKAANRASRTAAGIIKGKIAYMAPEQSVGAPVDRRTDVFALGATLWELSCDRRLFKHADETETLRRVHAADIPDPRRLIDGFPPALWRVLERALAREKDHRYATAAELARDLDAFARGVGTVDQQTVADTMRELFADDHSRPAARIAEWRRYGQSAATAVPDTQEAEVTRSRSNALVALGRPAAVAVREAGPSRGELVRIVVAMAVIVAIVVASIVSAR